MAAHPFPPKRLPSLLALLLAALLSVFGAAPAAHAIIGGQDAADPVGAVQVILANRSAFCTGILINPAWVLTAKHCIDPNNAQADNTHVFIGDLRFEQGERHDVLAIFQNPANDTALLQLTVRTDRLEMVVPYGANDPVVGAPATVKGWGGTQGNQTRPAPTLQIGQYIVASRPQNSDDMTLTSTDGSRTTNGDSGGPVIINGLVCGVHSSTNALSSTAVKSSALSSWIYQTARIFPGGACDLDTSKKKRNGLAQRIMAMGSSETVGYEGDGPGYRTFLKGMLTRSGLPSSFVGPDSAGPPPNDHLADGYEIKDMEDEAKCAVYDYAPDIVTLVAGEVDIAYFRDVPNAPARLDSVIDTIQEVSPRTVVLVGSIAPSTQPAYAPLITQYNASVKDRVLRRANAGQHVGYVDTGDLVTTSSDPVVVDGFSHENGPVELFPSGFFKEGAGFNLAIDKAVNSGWIPDSLSLNKGPCNGTDNGGGTGGGSGSSSTVPLRVMPTGDSITEGFGSTPGGFGNGYRYEVQQRVQNSGKKIDFVGENTDGTMTDPQNEGFSGKEIDYIATRAVPFAAAARPNVALVLAGTNDLGNNVDIAGAPGRLDTMIGELFKSAPDATLLVAGIPPSREGGFNSQRQAYNASVQSLVSDRAGSDQHVQYVDMNALDANTDMADNLHPNPSGYTIMGENFAKAIEGAVGKGWVKEPVPAQNNGGGAVGSGGTVGTAKKPVGPPPGSGTMTPVTGRLADGVGGDPDKSFTQFADVNGDGRADYLSIDAQGATTLYTNGGRKDDGSWSWIPLPSPLAFGIGDPGSEVRYADISGDGKADYLTVNAGGAVRAYLNGGPSGDGKWSWYGTPYPNQEVAGGIGAPGDTVRFGDINGDGFADYLSVDDHGAVNAYLNGGPKSDGTGWNWYPVGTQVASGVGAPDGSKYQFADINNDSWDDYVIFDAVDGSVHGWVNGGRKPDGTWIWAPQGQIAPGGGAPSTLLAPVLADLNADGRADYLAVNPRGSVNAWLNNGKDTSPVAGWLPVGGISNASDDLRWADLNEDGLSDYIQVDLKTGAASAYLNGGRKPDGSWIWFPQNKIADGQCGGQENCYVEFADINGDKRADYLVGDYTSGETSAWLNGGPATGGGLTWYPQGTAEIGFDLEPGTVIQWSDLNDDGYADMTMTAPDGTTDALQNFGPGSGGWTSNNRLGPLGEISGGPGSDQGYTNRFENFNNDGRADLLSVATDGSVALTTNQGGADSSNWFNGTQSTVASGTGAPGEQVQFADLNGDDRADYLIVPTTGEITAYLNNGGTYKATY